MNFFTMEQHIVNLERKWARTWIWIEGEAWNPYCLL